MSQLLLTCSLLLLLVGSPLFEGSGGSTILFAGAASFAALCTVWSIGGKEVVRWGLFFLALLPLTCGWVLILFNYTLINYCAEISGALFLLLSATILVVQLMRTKQFAAEKLFAVANAYILFGMGWGLVYYLVYQTDSNSFIFLVPSESVLISFLQLGVSVLAGSGVLLLHPASVFAGSLACVETVLGILYLAVLIGWFARALQCFKPNSVNSVSLAIDADPDYHGLYRRGRSNVPVSVLDISDTCSYKQVNE